MSESVIVGVVAGAFLWLFAVVHIGLIFHFDRLDKRREQPRRDPEDELTLTKPSVVYPIVLGVPVALAVSVYYGSAYPLGLALLLFIGPMANEFRLEVTA